MPKNTHKVPKKMWNKWTKDAQAMFNRLWYRLYPDMVVEALGTNHVSQKVFNILRWNICWTAADVMKDWDGFWFDQQKNKGKQIER